MTESSQEQKQHDEPIPGPSPAGPAYLLEPDMELPMNPALFAGRFLADLVRKPVHWFRENVVEPNKGPKYYWYHRKYPRVLPIDECYMDDLVCIHEAHLEYQRNFMVDRATLDLLRFRRDSCNYWMQTKHNRTYIADECQELADTHDREEINFFIKYGEMKFGSTVVHAYNKQKHRMIVERRRAILAEKGELPEVQS